MFAKDDSFSGFERALKQQDCDSEIDRFLAAVVATIKRRRRILRKGYHLFWAQTGYILKSEEDTGAEIPDAFVPERMKPPRSGAREGRVNRKGNPCLYLAEYKDTAMAEVRPWIGEYITLAEFEVVKDCKLVDCSGDKLTTMDLLMREDAATDEEREQAIWGDIAKAFSTPLTHRDKREEYRATQCLAERFKNCGYDGVAYQSALGKGRNVALFDPDAAHPINGTLFVTEAVEHRFGPANNTYYIPKYYPDWARRNGIDPESDVPYSMRIAAYLPPDAEDNDVATDEGAPKEESGKTS